MTTNNIQTLLAAILILSGGYAAAQQPNIVLIMVDDLGYHELGVTGQLERAANGEKAIETPNIDALAQQGLMVDNFYATPICSSTRGSLMTGFHNGHSSIDRNGGNNGGNALRSVDKTMAQVLQSAGYRTGIYGKWGINGYDHTITGGGVGDINTAAVTHPDATPVAKGFDEFYGYLNHVHAHDYYVNFLWEHDTDNSGNVGGVQIDPTSTNDYTHDLIANKSLEFVTNNADPSGENPFFLYLPYTIPHGEYNPPNDAIRQGYINAGYTNAQADYAAMIKRMDNSVGDVINRLKDPNGDGNQSDSVYDNTVLLFLSDNGGTSKNSLFNGGGDLRGRKGSVYEGGIKSPFIAHWNGTIAPGQVDSTSIAGLDDLFATVSDLAGAEREAALDGVSISGLLKGSTAERRHVYVFEGNGSNWAIRTDDWKLVNGDELYHLASDPDESSNVAAANPQIAALMNQIGIDEGVLSDAGTGAAQTTHIVQYKAWAPQAGSENWNEAANWSGGTEFNTRGTPANNFNTGPSSNWIASVDSPSATAQEIGINDHSEVLGLELDASNGQMTIRVANGASLMARNGARVGNGATIDIDGGKLHTMRAIHVQQGGVLQGSGEVTTSYDTTNTPFDLKADVVNEGLVDIAPAAGGQLELELVKNGGFEQGVQSDADVDYQFSEIDHWTTDGQVSNDAGKANNALTGNYRGLTAARSDGMHNTKQNTGHLLTLGETLQFEFSHRGFSGWDEGIDEVVASLFYLDDLQQSQLLAQASVAPSVGSWNDYTLNSIDVADPEAEGRQLWIEFDAVSGNALDANEFASVDNVSITVSTSVSPAPAILTVGGDFEQSATGSLAIDLLDAGGTAGVDYDKLQVAGEARLSGTLQVRLAPDLSFAPGMVFSVVGAESIDGTFDDVQLPPLHGGLELDVVYSSTEIRIEVAGVPGDYNLDGIVNIADYTVWRDNLGSQTLLAADGDGSGMVDVGDYLVWKAQFGQVAGGESATAQHSSTIPEPTSWIASFVGGALLRLAL